MEKDDPQTPHSARSIRAAIEDPRFLRRVDWNLFRQFHEIADAGSLSQAARRLNVKQPTLSAALRRLEGHLGLVLCRRTARGIELTPAGKALRDICGDLVDAVRLAPHVTSQAAKQVEGTLAIHLISNVVNQEVDEAISSFHRRHPRVEVELAVAPWRDVLEGLGSERADIGITYDSGPRPEFQYEPLFPETQQLYCGLHHPLFGQRVRDPGVLQQEQFIATGSDEPEDLLRFRRRYGLGQRSAGLAEDLHEAARLIRLGLGIGFLPTVVAEEKPGLWSLLNPEILPSYMIYVVAPPASRIRTPAQLFLEEIRRRLRAQPYGP